MACSTRSGRLPPVGSGLLAGPPPTLPRLADRRHRPTRVSVTPLYTDLLRWHFRREGVPFRGLMHFLRAAGTQHRRAKPDRARWYRALENNSITPRVH